VRDPSVLQSAIGDPGRILIFVPNWVGDVVMATAGLVAVRRRFPTARITLLERRYVAPVLADLSVADETIYWPETDPSPGMSRSIAGLIAHLRRERFALALLLTNSFRSALVAYLAGARRRVGYARGGRSWLLTDGLKPKKHGHEFVPIPALDYYNALVRHLGCNHVNDQLVLATSPSDEAAIDDRLGSTPPHHPLIVLNPGANYGSAKCWPAEKYAALADELVDRYDARVVASLSPKESEIADRLAAAVRRPIEIFVDPPLGLGPLKALVRRSRLLITNDTGPRHFAAAFGVPVVTIFGSSDPAWTDTRYSQERIAILDLDCQPCMERVCPLKHHHCMKLLEPELVLQKVRELLPLQKTAAALKVGAGQS